MWIPEQVRDDECGGGDAGSPPNRTSLTYARVLRVAWTIADLAGAEALSYRRRASRN